METQSLNLRYALLKRNINQKIDHLFIRRKLGDTDLDDTLYYRCNMLFLRPLFIMGFYAVVLVGDNYLIGNLGKSEVYESALQLMEEGNNLGDLCITLKRTLPGDIFSVSSLLSYIVTTSAASVSVLYRELRPTITAAQLERRLSSLSESSTSNDNTKFCDQLNEMKNFVVATKNKALLIHLLAFILPLASIFASSIYAKANGEGDMIDKICKCNGDISELYSCIGPVAYKDTWAIIVLNSMFLLLSTTVGVAADTTGRLARNVREILEEEILAPRTPASAPAR
jgi:hypothetical protein